ncbi:MAG: hypothetical protein LBT46_04705 [Planctomycetaceae bacterium]|nr:hypothetical protein [Planctomycetaceae bacterium]
MKKRLGNKSNRPDSRRDSRWGNSVCIVINQINEVRQLLQDEVSKRGWGGAVLILTFQSPVPQR